MEKNEIIDELRRKVSIYAKKCLNLKDELEGALRNRDVALEELKGMRTRLQKALDELKRVRAERAALPHADPGWLMEQIDKLEAERD